MKHEILKTAVAGSYPQPTWLIDRKQLGSRVPRLRAHDIWRIPEPYLEVAPLGALPGDLLTGLNRLADGDFR